jgi:inhibitor of KinA sporulation pathway (predicted exonuclease)
LLHAYLSLVDVEKTSGKSKYSSDAAKSIIEIKYKLINSAIADSKVDKHGGAKAL